MDQCEEQIRWAALADAIEATLPPREDRDLDATLFAGVTDARLRMAIIRACKASGVPTFTPHDLRHRRVSLLHRQGRAWAEIGRLVGQEALGDGRHLHARLERWAGGGLRGAPRRVDTATAMSKSAGMMP